ncbi:MAG TPA: polysaccharide biosynthesis tyrosine autokinase [Anaerolineae bacterium]|nr:polysaccharide biosynthesis tyrosine autokinase [Anaerolineae bacterium]
MSLITLTDPRSPVSEAYRKLRTNLSFYSLDDPIKTLVVTSAEPNEGKSTTVANLAVTMAQAGNKTIVVDCDLRKPSLHTLFDLPNDKGFTDLMLSDADELPLQKIAAVDNLFVLTSGEIPPNPADILGSKKVTGIIERLVNSADIVLFDAPPVIAVTDAVVLGTKVDGVLLVLQAGKSRRDHAERAKQLLEQAKVRIVGATLTNAPKDDAVSSYYG